MVVWPWASAAKSKRRLDRLLEPGRVTSPRAAVMGLRVKVSINCLIVLEKGPFYRKRAPLCYGRGLIVGFCWGLLKIVSQWQLFSQLIEHLHDAEGLGQRNNRAFELAGTDTASRLAHLKNKAIGGVALADGFGLGPLAALKQTHSIRVGRLKIGVIDAAVIAK